MEVHAAWILATIAELEREIITEQMTDRKNDQMAGKKNIQREASIWLSLE